MAGGTLLRKDSGVLLPTLADWFKEVRLLGNDAVHDLTVDVSMEDASVSNCR